MRYSWTLGIAFCLGLNSFFPSQASDAVEELDDEILALKVEVLGGTVVWDELQPTRTVTKVAFRGKTRFDKRYLHILKGFKHLQSIDLGNVPVTPEIVEQIEQPQVLANMLLDGDRRQYGVVFPKFSLLGERGLNYVKAELDRQPLPGSMPSSAVTREVRAKRLVNAAVTLLGGQQPDKVWPLLKHRPDPRVRSYLIHRIAAAGIDPTVILQRLSEDPDVSIRRALILSLGEYQVRKFPEELRADVEAKVRAIYRSESDAGLHAAAHWLLEQMGEHEWLREQDAAWLRDDGWKLMLGRVLRALVAGDESLAPQWLLNSQGQTMAVISGPASFMMGSPDTELERNLDEHQHLRRFDHSYAISATHVTLEQFRKFDEKWDELSKLKTWGDTPVVEIDWLQGTRYCNWLSEQEGLEACYEIQGKEVFIKENWESLSGYRYPSEAEIEYATRAGSTTCRFYGETDELLSRYAIYRGAAAGAARRVALRKPNDWGLFDAHGNAFVWCQERYDALPELRREEPSKDGLIAIDLSKSRVLRGGSAGDPSSYVKSAYRMGQPPLTRALYIGFRIARTMKQSER